MKFFLEIGFQIVNEISFSSLAILNLSNFDGVSELIDNQVPRNNGYYYSFSKWVISLHYRNSELQLVIFAVLALTVEI